MSTAVAPAATAPIMMSQKKAAELCTRLEQRRMELEKARAELGLTNGDTLEAFEARTTAALKRYNEVILPPLRDQVQQFEKRCPPRPATPSTTTAAATTSPTTRVAELQEKIAQVDKRLAQLEKEQAVRDVAMDAVQALDEKAELEKALEEALKQQPQPQPQQSSGAMPEISEATRFAIERWIAARLTTLEQDAARGSLAEPSAASFAAPSNTDLPPFKDLALIKVEPTGKTASTAGLEKIFQ